jgi:tetratricopeptide (TPR) repeat protein
MTKVSLRVYNREIEGMIESSQLDEAIAHCQHILKAYPMHVETYRLLGKTFLEARKYGDAADIFQRALMAVPDDFVSHVGMSIIRDDEGKLDEAIWHMERAFEIQPSNSAIQGELRRLYGRRDGVEPPKIRLSRDALANMYSQGELFNQAIAEIRSVLADDPNRPDLRVMLARAYYRAGKKVEAAEMAAILLKKYPFCLDALRILVDVLPDTTQGENTQIYRHRLGLLDPYSNFAKDSAFNSDQAPDASVNVERLDYKPGITPTASQPDWASSLGIQLEGEKRTESTPEWLKSEGVSTQAKAGEGGSGTSETGQEEDAVPDWMRAAGWQPSTGADQEASLEQDEEQVVGPIAQAEIPDWVKSMAPANLEETDQPQEELPGEERSGSEREIPDWLKAAAPAAATATEGELKSADEPPSSGNVKPVTSEPGDIPEWLKSTSLSSETDFESGRNTTLPEEALEMNGDSEPFEEEIPKLSNSTGHATSAGMESIETEPSSSDDLLPVGREHTSLEEGMPDWMKPSSETMSNEDEDNESASSAGEIRSGSVESVSSETEDTPDWKKLQEITSGDHDIKTEVSPPNKDNTGTTEHAEIPDWVKSMAPINYAEAESTEESIAPMEAQLYEDVSKQPPDDKLPDWLKPTSSAEGDDMENTVNDAVPDNSSSENEKPVSGEEESFPDWLKSLAPEEEAKVELEDTRPSAAVQLPRSDEAEASGEGAFPDWLSSLDQGSQVAPSTETESNLQPPSNLEVPHQPSEVEPLKGRPENIIPVDVEPAVQESTTSASLDKSTENQDFIPSGSVKPLDIGDDTLGWLESLAAKQGANAEELLTNPQERQAEMPDWIKPVEEQEETTVNLKMDRSQDKDAAQVEIEESGTASKPDTDEVNPEVGETGLPEEIGNAAAQPVKIEDDTMAWLEGLAANQGAKPEELLTKPEDRSEATPDWIQQSVTEEPVQPAIPSGDMNDKVIKPEDTLSEEDITVTKWLSNLEEEEGDAAPPIPITPGEIQSAEEELPDWLADLEKNKAPEPAIQKPEIEGDLPDWLRKATQPGEKHIEDKPAITEKTSEALQEEMPAWMEEPADVTGQAAPTVPDEWVPAESTNASPEVEVGHETTPVEKQEEAVVSVPPEQPTKKTTSELQPATSHNKDAEVLTSAQAALENNSLNEAIKEYGKLIKRGHLLDEVIHDLREAIYRYPVDVIIWQALGDAYMRANRLQDALDAYTKAEELLR